MRSYFKPTGTAVIAAAAFFAVVTATSTANAAISQRAVNQARHEVVQDLRDECRQNPQVDTRRERRSCARSVENTLRDLQRQAEQAERACRRAGGGRFNCEQAERQFWLDQAANNGDTSGGDTGGGDTLPPDQIPQ
jgi:hypothetical protein